MVGYFRKDRSITTRPQYGTIALFWKEKKLAHSAFVLGTSKKGDVYLLQKLNSGKPIVVTTAASPALEGFGKPTYYKK